MGPSHSRSAARRPRVARGCIQRSTADVQPEKLQPDSLAARGEPQGCGTGSSGAVAAGPPRRRSRATPGPSGTAPLPPRAGCASLSRRRAEPRQAPSPTCGRGSGRSCGRRLRRSPRAAGPRAAPRPDHSAHDLQPRQARAAQHPSAPGRHAVPFVVGAERRQPAVRVDRHGHEAPVNPAPRAGLRRQAELSAHRAGAGPSRPRRLASRGGTECGPAAASDEGPARSQESESRGSPPGRVGGCGRNPPDQDGRRRSLRSRPLMGLGVGPSVLAGGDGGEGSPVRLLGGVGPDGALPQWSWRSLAGLAMRSHALDRASRATGSWRLAGSDAGRRRRT